MRLIPNWRKAWRMLSMHVAALAVGWGALPVDSQAAILEVVGMGPERVPLVFGVLFLVGRLIDQGETTR